MDEIKRHDALEARLWVEHNSKHVITPTILALLAERDDLADRLAALLDAIGDPRRVRSMTVTLHPGKSWYPTGPWMLRIADAAAAAREELL